MEYRKFYFRNGRGEQIPLNGENGIYASDPSGLGVDRSRTSGQNPGQSKR